MRSNTDVANPGQTFGFDRVEVVDDGLLSEVVGGGRGSLKTVKETRLVSLKISEVKMNCLILTRQKRSPKRTSAVGIVCEEQTDKPEQRRRQNGERPWTRIAATGSSGIGDERELWPSQKAHGEATVQEKDTAWLSSTHRRSLIEADAGDSR
jgi:hypothetical protein